MDAGLVRRTWVATEHVHLVTYFAAEPRAAYEAAGVTGFWRGYFGGRAAPMGRVGPGPVVATFHGFHPDFVARAVPDVWERATPEALLAARADGAATALRRMFAEAGVGVAEAELGDLAQRLDAALRSCSASGRALFAANLDVPVPEDPVAALWQACTLWREHRGDGHVAALVAAGLDGCEAHVLRLAVDGGDPVLMRGARGWSDDDWSAAGDRLAARGILDERRAATEEGRTLAAEVEAITDLAAVAALAALGAAAVDDALSVLEPLARAVAATADIPANNPIGVPAPR